MTAARSEAATVADIMTEAAIKAAPETPVGAARRMLKDAWIRHLPVLDGELLVGIVSDRDLGRAPSDATPLRDIMTRTVFVLSPDTPIRRAAHVFRDRRLGALPVLEGRKLVGIVSALDVVGSVT